MKIEFHRTGGFGGPATNKTMVLESESLSPNEEKQLKDLVASAARASSNIPDGSSNPQLRDAFNYQVTIDRGDHSLTFTGPMVDIPEQARPLIRWLDQRANRR